eukprot:381717_1
MPPSPKQSNDSLILTHNIRQIPHSPSVTINGNLSSSSSENEEIKHKPQTIHKQRRSFQITRRALSPPSTSMLAMGLLHQVMALVAHGHPVESFISTYKQYRGLGIEVYQFNMMENISLINQEEYRDNDGLFRFKLISRECDDSVVTNDFSQSTWPTNTNQFFYYNMPGGVSSDCVHERSQFLYLFNPGNKVEVEIYSHGVHSSPRSYINLDGNSVIGTGRGFNIVVLDQDNINIDVFDTFDPYGDGRQRNEQSTDDAMEFLKEISVGRLVIITGWGSVIGLHNDIGMIDSDGDMVRSQRIFNFLNSWGCNVQETNKNRPFIFIGYAGINNVIHCEVGSYEGELEFQYILN